MPEIARFYGIVIKMFFKPKEHEPSHIHALYGEYLGEFNIRTMEMIQGDLPRKAQELLRDVPGLFQQVQLDESRTCVYWNDEIDLPSDSIYEYGRSVR